MTIKEDQRKSKEIIAELRSEIVNLKTLQTPLLKTLPNESSEFYNNDPLHENGNGKLYLNELPSQANYSNCQRPGVFG